MHRWTLSCISLGCCLFIFAVLDDPAIIVAVCLKHRSILLLCAALIYLEQVACQLTSIEHNFLFSDNTHLLQGVGMTALLA